MSYILIISLLWYLLYLLYFSCFWIFVLVANKFLAMHTESVQCLHRNADDCWDAILCCDLSVYLLHRHIELVVVSNNNSRVYICIMQNKNFSFSVYARRYNNQWCDWGAANKIDNCSVWHLRLFVLLAVVYLCWKLHDLLLLGSVLQGGPEKVATVGQRSCHYMVAHKFVRCWPVIEIHHKTWQKIVFLWQKNTALLVAKNNKMNTNDILPRIVPTLLEWCFWGPCRLYCFMCILYCEMWTVSSCSTVCEYFPSLMLLVCTWRQSWCRPMT